MNQDRTKRKLTAILSADVVGYSRLMEADEAWTIQSLEENKKLMSSFIEEHNGRVVDASGDNLLAEFSSVINAVECAVKVQNQLNIKNSKLMEDNRMHFRIGINLGDVVEEENRIYGNGVNIAARLEGLAEPGGICISHTAYDQVKSKVNVEYDNLGEFQVKNINEPIRVYRILIGDENTEKYVLHSKYKKIVNPISVLSAVIILLVIALGTTIVIFYPKLSEHPQVIRFKYELPDGQKFSRSTISYPFLTISPDGSKLVYSTTKGLFLRSMDELNGRLIAGTDESSIQPFFSPDGQWIGFWSGTDQTLKKVAVSGGIPTPLCHADPAGGFSWTADNRILHGSGRNIMWVSPNGGNWTPLIEQKSGLLGAPKMFPGGEAVMYFDVSKSPWKIIVQSLKSGESKELLNSTFAQYVKTGHIIYGQENNLYAIPFDVDTLEITGEAVFLVEDVLNTIYYWHYAISDSGTLVYVPRMSSLGFRKFVWVDKEGKEEPLGLESNNYSMGFKISPDGSRVALGCIESGDTDIYIWDIGHKKNTRFTFDSVNDFYPLWTLPDGGQIIFSSTREEGMGFYRKAADGSGKEEKIYSSLEMLIYPYSISTNGKTLFFDALLGDNQYDIGMTSLEVNSAPKFLLQEEFNEVFPKISPNGRWLAYVSDKSGKDEIYVSPFPDVDSGIWQVSEDGGNFPLWSPDGKELYYLNSEAVMAVSVETEPVFKPGKSRSLFQNKYVGNFDIHPNGRKFLMLKTVETVDTESSEKISSKIITVVNWFEELKEKVPVD
jgi:class 3 adenylate cyclase/Tol biopolymer transport system component